MPYCKECGSETEQGAKFCPECGTPSASTKSGARGTRSLAAQPGKGEGPAPEEGIMVRDTGFYGRLDLGQLPQGHVVDDRYDIKKKIGQGGFGAVYMAYDRKMAVDKALKIIPEAVVNDLESMTHLRAEARTMLRLNHPNIVRVFDFHDSGQLCYIDMEFVDGENLSAVKLGRPGGRVLENEAVAFGLQIASGLHYAHSQRVIHKDVKPQNVLLGRDGIIKIMDFGIAETVRSSMSRLDQSSSAGTLLYMSPEQLRGREVGREADIYAFGAMLYELVSGHPPFWRGDINFQILNEVPKNIEGVSDKLNTVLARCLLKEYKERYADFSEVIAALGGTAERFAAAAPDAPAPQAGYRETAPDEILCPKCGKRNKEARRFCLSCGEGLYRTCVSCGKEERIDIEICGHCGMSVQKHVLKKLEELKARKDVLEVFEDEITALKKYGVLAPELAASRTQLAQKMVMQVIDRAMQHRIAMIPEEIARWKERLLAYGVLSDEIEKAAEKLDGFYRQKKESEQKAKNEHVRSMLKNGSKGFYTVDSLVALFNEIQKQGVLTEEVNQARNEAMAELIRKIFRDSAAFESSHEVLVAKSAFVRHGMGSVLLDEMAQKHLDRLKRKKIVIASVIVFVVLVLVIVIVNAS